MDIPDEPLRCTESVVADHLSAKLFGHGSGQTDGIAFHDDIEIGSRAI